MARNAIAFEVKEHDDTARSTPGAYHFVHRHSDPDGSPACGIIHACPCGCGVSTLLYFRGRGDGKSDEWDVSGEWPKVTLKPSIGIRRLEGGGFHWHGYLEEGVFVER